MNKLSKSVWFGAMVFVFKSIRQGAPSATFAYCVDFAADVRL